MTAKRQTLRQIADALEPGLRQAFLDAVADIKQTTVIKRLVAALEAGRTEELLRALDLDQSFLAPLEEAIRSSFAAAGAEAARALPSLPASGGRIVARFNGANPRAAEWVSRRGAALVTEILEDQRLGIRRFVEESYAVGRHPKQIALDLVGRVDPLSGRRRGGIIGLRSDQMRAVARMRSELSGVPSAAAYRRRGARDRAFDRLIATAEQEGRKLDQATIGRILARYEDNLLKVRGEAIARTEALAGAARAQVEGVQQMIDAGKLSERHVKKKWSATDAFKSKGSRTRDSHIALNGTVLPWGEAFVSPTTGRRMMHPGDTSLGAHGEDTINCRCFMHIQIDRYAALREMEQGA